MPVVFIGMYNQAIGIATRTQKWTQVSVVEDKGFACVQFVHPLAIWYCFWGDYFVVCESHRHRTIECMMTKDSSFESNFVINEVLK